MPLDKVKKSKMYVTLDYKPHEMKKQLYKLWLTNK